MRRKRALDFGDGKKSPSSGASEMGEREDKSGGRELGPWSKFEEEGREKKAERETIGRIGEGGGPCS